MDKALITARAGDGGNGCVSYHTSRRVSKGGPDGGNGGNGGNIIFVGNTDICTLDYYRYSHKLKAANGTNGSAQNMHGKHGQDLMCHVPLGTQIYKLKACDENMIAYCRRCRSKKNRLEQSVDITKQSDTYHEQSQINMDECTGNMDECTGCCTCSADIQDCIGCCKCIKPISAQDDTVTDLHWQIDYSKLNQSMLLCIGCCQCHEHVDPYEHAAHNEHAACDDSEVYCKNCKAELTDDDKYDEELLIDITENNQRYIAVKGGIGGFGNTYYKNASNQTPDYAQKGTQGSSDKFVLRLKLIADVGIIGFPNAGKSSFLRSISNSKTKVADYPFTTLTPELGTMIYNGKHIIFADIPGLIEDAHIGKGLGHYFLSHIERCGMLLHLIDMTQDNLLHIYKLIRNELGKYDDRLLMKPEIVVLTKKDMCTEDEIQRAIELFQAEHMHVICISNFEMNIKHDLFAQIEHILSEQRSVE